MHKFRSCYAGSDIPFHQSFAIVTQMVNRQADDGYFASQDGHYEAATRLARSAIIRKANCRSMIPPFLSRLSPRPCSKSSKVCLTSG